MQAGKATVSSSASKEACRAIESLQSMLAAGIISADEFQLYLGGFPSPQGSGVVASGTRAGTSGGAGSAGAGAEVPSTPRSQGVGAST